MTTTVSLAPAWVGLGGVLLGAAIAAATAARRERVARRETAQREALYALQDACLALRQAYQALARVQDQQVASAEAGREVTRARQVLELSEARIRCDCVLARVASWRKIVAPAVLQDDIRKVSAATEGAAWQAVQDVVK